MTNEQIIERIRTTGDETRELIAQLYTQNTGLILKTSAPYIDAGMEPDDAMQEGYIALVQAVNNYDPKAGAAFSTYLCYWIRATVARAFCNTGNVKRLPASVTRQIYQYKKICQECERETGRAPDDSYLRACMGVNPDQLEFLRQVIRESAVSSLSEKMPGAEDLTIADSVPDPADMIGDACDAIDDERAARELWATVDALQDNQPEILKLRYRECRSINATAEQLQTTPGKVKRAESYGLRRLRNSKKIKQIAGDCGYSTAALFGGSLARFKTTGSSIIEETVLKLWE